MSDVQDIPVDDAAASMFMSTVQDLDPAETQEWLDSLNYVLQSKGAGLGGLALVLAAVGVYAIVSYAVTRRYREIGIRLAFNWMSWLQDAMLACTALI